MKKYIAACAAVLLCAGMSVGVGAQGWVGEEGESEYIRSNGQNATGVVVIEGKAYLFGEDGSPKGMYTGLTSDSKGLYYYEDGVMFKDGWLELDGDKFYFEDGKAKTGKDIIDGKSCAFDSKGRLITSSNRNAYTVTADRDTVSVGSGDRMTVTVSTDIISDMAYIYPTVSLQRYSEGRWLGLKSNTDLNAVIVNSAQLGQVSEKEYRNEAQFVFTPDLYSDMLSEGHYRLAVPVAAGEKTVTLYYEFDIVKNAVTTSDKPAYDIRSTTRITFDTYLKQDEHVYPKVNELYFRENGKWVLVAPKKGKELVSETTLAKKGTTFTSTLDLTRYNRTSLKTGRYMVYVGDGIQSEFRLTNPVDVEAYQIDAQQDGNVKVRLTLHPRKYDVTEIDEYGEMYYYTGGKWLKMDKRKSKLPGGLVLEKGYVYMQDFLVTDYYKQRDLKSGKYAIRLHLTTGEYMEVYFDLKV